MREHRYSVFSKLQAEWILGASTRDAGEKPGAKHGMVVRGGLSGSRALQVSTTPRRLRGLSGWLMNISHSHAYLARNGCLGRT